MIKDKIKYSEELSDKQAPTIRLQKNSCFIAKHERWGIGAS